jgi:hypothetical protein
MGIDVLRWRLVVDLLLDINGTDGEVQLMVVMRSSRSLCNSVDALRCAKNNNTNKLASCVPISARFKNKIRALFCSGGSSESRTTTFR